MIAASGKAKTQRRRVTSRENEGRWKIVIKIGHVHGRVHAARIPRQSRKLLDSDGHQQPLRPLQARRRDRKLGGNSPNVIHRHYKALVKETEAKEFWEITPATVKSKIAKLPDQAAAAA